MTPVDLPRIRCSISFLTATEGGRDAPPRNLAGGTYRPHVVLESIVVPTDLDCLGVAFVSGPSSFGAGEIVSAEFVCLYHPRVSYAGLEPGSRFRILEGTRVVALGKVVVEPATDSSVSSVTQRITTSRGE